jgi:protoporphyrin/coproporphyrin ferrochelatase
MRNSKPDFAVLLMAHGTPESIDQMPEYLRLVRGGREPSQDLIEEMKHNWRTIGGHSPLTEITRQQGAALQVVLAADGFEVPVAVGMRNWKPFIADAMREIAASGATRVIGIPLAPQFSTLSVQKYMDAATSALPSGMELNCVRSFHDHPLLIEAFAEKVLAENPRPGEEIIFTAHSLPHRVVTTGDPYPDQVKATAKAVAERCGIDAYHRAYQSAGRTPEPWLGPDLSELIRARASAGIRRMLVVPIGFVCDHTEILFDVDVQAAEVAQQAGVSLRRTQSLNSSPTFIRTLAALVAQAVATPA